MCGSETSPSSLVPYLRGKGFIPSLSFQHSAILPQNTQKLNIMSNSVENSMKFTGETYTVAEFKQLCGSKTLDVLEKKEKPGEFFFVCGTKRGYNAGGKRNFDNPVVSRCERLNAAAGEDQFFFMLHEAPDYSERVAYSL